jgi:hypothetical protein
MNKYFYGFFLMLFVFCLIPLASAADWLNEPHNLPYNPATLTYSGVEIYTHQWRLYQLNATLNETRCDATGCFIMAEAHDITKPLANGTVVNGACLIDLNSLGGLNTTTHYWIEAYKIGDGTFASGETVAVNAVPVNKTRFDYGDFGNEDGNFISKRIFCFSGFATNNETSQNITEIWLTSSDPDQKLYSPYKRGNTTDTTPTFNISTSLSAVCAFGTDNLTWTTCGTTGGTGHFCTQPTILPRGKNIMYFNCANQSYVNITYDILGEAMMWQYVQVLNFNNTDINYSLTVTVYNNGTTNLTDIAVGVDSKFGAGYNISNISVGAMNTTILYNWSKRPASTDSWFNISAANISGGAIANSNAITMILPVDPPTKAGADTCTTPGAGDWNLNCADMCNITTVRQVLGNINIFGSGTVNVSSILNFTSTGQYIIINGTACELDVVSGGSINGQ